MQKERKKTLVAQIRSELICYYAIPFILLMLSVASAVAVVVITNNTRALINQREFLAEENERLDNEWRNLILEQNALSEHSRVQDLVHQQLDMQLPSIKNEIVIKK